MNVLLILNDPPYGTERSYNGLRLAMALQKVEGMQAHVFLMADAIRCAQRGQQTADGHYNLERMIRGVLTRGGTVKACGTCMDARGMADADLVDGVQRSNMAELAGWAIDADRVITF